LQQETVRCAGRFLFTYNKSEKFFPLFRNRVEQGKKSINVLWRILLMLQGRIGLLIASVILSASLITSAQEPVKPPLSARIITATRQVAIFTDLETQILRAIKAKDQAALSKLVSEDCLIEMPDSDPLPADEWMTTVLAKDYTLKSFAVRQVSAIDQNDTVIVKYDRVQEAAYKGAPDNGEFFVIDLWKKSGDAWKLANRYVAKVSSVPWMPPKGDVKPTGKR
jgi:ketosteroid isomerase-like protein